MKRAAFANLNDAVEWLRQAWEARETPMRLHEHAFDDGGAPRYTAVFARHLRATPGDQQHDHGATSALDACPYRYPMWRAMSMLRAATRRSHDAVLTLVINAYDVPGTLMVMGMREERLLDAIRGLHSRYRLAPEVRRWTDKSQSQQSAELAVA